MLITKKIRLKPTPEQEILFRKSAGTARWAYNFYLAENERVYQEYLSNGKTEKRRISEGEIRKYINNELKPNSHSWLKEVGSNVMKQGVKDADIAMRRYFEGTSSKPKFKSKHKNKLSFYVNYESLSRKQGGFHGEKIGFVKTSEPLPKLKKGEKYSNPRITYDGKYWYLSVGYEVEEEPLKTTGESLGIDLGIKDLAVCSNGKVYKNINKTQRVKKLEKRLRREQRKLSRKIENNKKTKKSLTEGKNFQKQKHSLQMTHRKLKNIRQNHLHQTTTEIVKTKPSRIVMEDLNVRGMMKNKYLAKAIQQQCFYEFRRQIEYKSKLNGIEFVKADRFYPSSKICSDCGKVKKDLKLSDRTYKCDNCGLIIDRDFNASLNLANYKSI